MWNGSTVRTISPPMRATSIHLKPGRLSPLPCLSCGKELILSQPDTEVPEQLVGICKNESSHGACEHCGGLHLIVLTEEDEAVLLLMPSPPEIAAAMEQPVR